MAMKRLLITAWMVTVVIGRSIRNEIEQRPELSETRRHLQGLDIWNYLAFDDTYTFFAPINGAYNNIPQSVRSDLESTSDSVNVRVNKMFLHHAVFDQQVLTTEIGTGSSVKSMAQGSPLFLRDVSGVKFVNDARFNYSDILCDNGVLHVVDTFMYEEIENKPAYSVIEDMSNVPNSEESTRYFLQLLDTYKNEQSSTTVYWSLNGLNDVFVTIFIPSDSTFEPLISANPNFMRQLENNKNELVKVIESHVIVGDASAVYHSSVLQALGDRNAQIDASYGAVVPKFFNHELYVSNNCAQGRITRASTTVSNGVIHIVDGILGYLYYDMFQLLTHNPQLSDMKTFAGMASPEIQNILEVSGSTSAPLPASEKYTLFAPLDSAFDPFERPESTVDISQDRVEIDTFFRFHLLEDEVKQMDMSNTSRHHTMQSNSTAKFYKDLDGTTWVEVNHVKARIVRADYCVHNGIVHFVDHVLGLAQYTIFEAIQQHDDLRELQQSIRRTGYDTYLDSKFKTLTFFAPTDRAFQMMREGAVGRDFLDDDNLLRHLLQRHFCTQVYWLDDITSSRTLRTDAGVDITITRQQDNRYLIDYSGKEIQVLMRDEKMINGVLNIIDAVIYRETPRDLEISSTGNHVVLSSVLGALMTLLFSVVY